VLDGMQVEKRKGRVRERLEREGGREEQMREDKIT